MTSAHLEVERSFTPSSGYELPDLTELEQVHRVERAGGAELDATYYDTAGLALLRAGVTLRRRTGGDDAGWHLKLPVDTPGGREELHSPAGGGHQSPPVELLDLVAGWTRGIAVSPVARLETTRTTWRIVGSGEQSLAELVDDRVVGRPAQLGADETRWREWEVELVDGEVQLLDDIEELFAAAGIERSGIALKLGHVLAVPPARDAELDPPRKKGPARLLLHRWLVDQVRQIELLDPVARRGGDGGVHGLRKACRRLRAALATYRPLVDREVTDPVRDELRWLARSLGSVRDDEVVLERLDQLLDAESDGPDEHSARRLLERRAVARAYAGQAEIGAVLGSRRYFELRASLDALADDPPWTEVAEEPARDVLPRLVRKDGKRTRRRYRRGEDPHEVRKAAKRLRYAYELLEPAWGKKAARPRKAAKDLTRLLGDRQDSLAAREWLVALSAEAHRTGDSAFILGRLHALEEAREVERLGQALTAWRELDSVRW